MIRQALHRLAERYLPTRTLRVHDTRHDPPSLAATLDVDSLHAILAEAQSGNTKRLFAVYRDLVLGHSHGQSEFNTRKLAVVGERPVFQPWDKADPDSVAAATLVESLWQSYPGGRAAVTHLLDASLWPVAVVEKTYKPGTKPGHRWEIRDLRPVPYHLLDYVEGRLRIQEVSPQGHPLGTFHDPDPRRYIVHRGHLMTSIPDHFGGPMRAALFWWLFSTMDRDWWIRFLERFGAPFIVGKYDPADDGARSLLRNAFSAATRLFGLVVSRDTQVEVHSTNSNSHGDAFEQFHDTAKRELSKLILGQTMTSEAQAGGIGGTQATVHDGVRGDIRKFDAHCLDDTLRHQLFAQILDLNGYPGVLPPSVSWGAEGSDAKLLAETIELLNRAGIRPTADALTDLSLDLGFPVERHVSDTPGPPLGFPTTARPAADASLQSTDAEPAAVAAASLNGAQIKSLLEIIASVGDGTLPKSTAPHVIEASFPFDRAKIDRLLEDAASAKVDLDAFSASPSSLTGAQAAESIAAHVARDLAATNRRRLRRALANSTDFAEFQAALDFPDDADLAARLLVSSAVNALGR